MRIKLSQRCAVSGAALEAMHRAHTRGGLSLVVSGKRSRNGGKNGGLTIYTSWHPIVLEGKLPIVRRTFPPPLAQQIKLLRKSFQCSCGLYPHLTSRCTGCVRRVIDITAFYAAERALQIGYKMIFWIGETAVGH